MVITRVIATTLRVAVWTPIFKGAGNIPENYHWSRIRKEVLQILFVNLKGTFFDSEKQLIMPVHDTRYVFDGKEYVLEE